MKTLRKIVSLLKRIYEYLKDQNLQSIEMHNRVMRQLDERYTQNWYSIRGGML